MGKKRKDESEEEQRKPWIMRKDRYEKKSVRLFITWLNYFRITRKPREQSRMARRGNINSEINRVTFQTI
jgi:hypothetical protein